MIVKAMNRWHMIEVDLAVTLAISRGVQVLSGHWAKPLVSDCQSIAPKISTAMRWRSERFTSGIEFPICFSGSGRGSSSVAFSFT